MLIYDIEITNAIKNKNEKCIDNITYCDGWSDHENMGISVVGVYDYVEDRYRTFCADNLMEFKKLCKHRFPLIGFNNIAFDNRVLACNDVAIPASYCYDILVEVWKASGLNDSFRYPSHAGFGLDACVKANFPSIGKTGNGAVAPVHWQHGRIGTVIDYCLSDVWLTKKLMDKIITSGSVISPVTGKKLFISPWKDRIR